MAPPHDAKERPGTGRSSTNANRDVDERHSAVDRRWDTDRTLDDAGRFIRNRLDPSAADVTVDPYRRDNSPAAWTRTPRPGMLRWPYDRTGQPKPEAPQ